MKKKVTETLIGLTVVLAALYFGGVFESKDSVTDIEEYRSSPLGSDASDDLVEKYLYVHSEKLNVREGRSTQSNVVGQLDKGDYIKVVIDSTGSEWAKYSDDGIEGFVYLPLLKDYHPNPFMTQFAITRYGFELLLAVKPVIADLLNANSLKMEAEFHRAEVDIKLWQLMDSQGKETLMKHLVIYANLLTRSEAEYFFVANSSNQELLGRYDAPNDFRIIKHF